MDYRNVDVSHVAMSPSPNMGNKIHVLLVEHDPSDHDNIINMLRCFSYEVSHPSSSLSVMSKEKAQFDLMIANMNSPDSFGYQLLRHALNMKLLVILTSKVEDVERTMKELQQGVILWLKKPLTMQVLGYLWQHISRDKLLNKKDQNPQTLASGGHPSNDKNAPHDLFRHKVWTEWTVELHDKFMKAARFLGPGKCYPKDILELMNVPGLTRMQVASHLQKCRNAKLLPTQKNKLAHNHERLQHPPKRAPRTRHVRFGSMPIFNDDDVIEIPPIQQLQPIQEHQNSNRMVNLGEVAAMGPYGEGTSRGYINPEMYPLNYGISHDVINGVVGVEEIGQGFTMEEPVMYDLAGGQTLPPVVDVALNDVAYSDAFGAPAPYMDPMMSQSFSQFQQPELEFDFNKIWQSLVLGQENNVDQVATFGGDVGDQY